MLIRNGVSDNIFHDNIFSCVIDWQDEKHKRQPNRLLMNPPYLQAKKSETSSESEMQCKQNTGSKIMSCQMRFPVTGQQYGEIWNEPEDAAVPYGA